VDLAFQSLQLSRCKAYADTERQTNRQTGLQQRTSRRDSLLTLTRHGNSWCYLLTDSMMSASSTPSQRSFWRSLTRRL